MKVNINQDECQVIFEFCIERDRIEEEKERLFQKYRQLNIPGFRKGKVPLEVIKRMYSKEVQQEALNNLINESYKNTLKEKNIQVITTGQAYDINLTEEGFKFKIKTEVLPKIEIIEKDYKNIELKTYKIKIKNQDIEEELKRLQLQHATLVPIIEERGAKPEDIILVDIKAYVNNDGNKKEVINRTTMLELGKNNILPGFDEKVEGMRRQEIRRFSLKAPSDFYIKDIASKTIDFKVKLLELKHKELPLINHDFAKDLGYDNLDELKKEIQKKLSNEKKLIRERELKEKIADKLTQTVNFPLPKSLLNIEIKNLYYSLVYNLRLLGVNEKDFFKIKNLKEEEIYDKIKPYAEKRLKTVLILAEIAKRENIVVNDEEYKNWLYTKLKGDNRRMQEILNNQKQNDLFKEEFRLEKTLEFILKSAKLKETNEAL